MDGFGPGTALARSPLRAGNPRRQPAHRSVSLRQPARSGAFGGKQRKSDSSGDSTRPVHASALRESVVAHASSPSSPPPLGGQNSSGSGGSSNAECWFDKSNNNVRDGGRTAFADNDSPYLMRRSSSDETPPDAVAAPGQRQLLVDRLDASDSNTSLPLRAGMMQLGTGGSSTDDFRGVIDDLTIKNKKLRRRLKKYEKLHDAHLKDEKLFEVRFHGLPAEKKRELEDTLRRFAATLHTGGANAFPANGYATLLPMLATGKNASPQTSSMQNSDSAYVSMSASNQGSSAAQSAGDARGAAASIARVDPAYLASRRQNIHSYLHDIPEGLLPHPARASLSETAKKKLVARRLEVIFAGKVAAKTGHQQPLQQQEVSKSAARADRSAVEDTGQWVDNEGSREASIMRALGAQAASALKKREAPMSDVPHSPSAAAASHDAERLEQRPTRPLDLDPQRAQVPDENIRYMRHLGFSPLDPAHAASPEDDHGWIYLNFLINMAQLHTFNVTPEFVRKALVEYSSRFDMSADGRKVRWKGNRPSAQLRNSGNDSLHELGEESDSPVVQSPRKRTKLSRNDSTLSQRAASRRHPGSLSQRMAESNKYSYTPLFFHRDSSNGADDSSSSDESEDSDNGSPMFGQVQANSSGMTGSEIQTSSGLRTSSGPRMGSGKKKSKRDEGGPIIFYNNVNFCTDLSGDSRANVLRDVGPYTTATDHPIGRPQPPAANELFERRGPLASSSELPDAMQLSDNPIPDSMELSFPAVSPLKAGVEERPVELEVTGIGGVWPADNFAISVESAHAARDQRSAPETIVSGPTKRSLPPRLAKILHDDSPEPRPAYRAAVHKQILASRHQTLAPSPLPPAIGFVPFGNDGLGDDDESDVGDIAMDDVSLSPVSPVAFPPSTAPQPVDFAFASTGSEDMDDDSDDDDDDNDDSGSVDLLAAARRADPDAVRAREREYDADLAERLADEIPAGSSAATAGGGSGFASPASDKHGDEYARARKDARTAAAAVAAASGARMPPSTLKRARTDDSNVAQRPWASDDESDRDDGAVSDVPS